MTVKELIADLKGRAGDDAPVLLDSPNSRLEVPFSKDGEDFTALIKIPLKPSEQFAVGDVVQLKSGGPAMTVCALYGDDGWRVGLVWCREGEINEGSLQTSILQSYDPKMDPNLKWVRTNDGVHVGLPGEVIQ